MNERDKKLAEEIVRKLFDSGYLCDDDDDYVDDIAEEVAQLLAGQREKWIKEMKHWWDGVEIKTKHGEGFKKGLYQAVIILGGE